ncbi:site-2 protease family protein [Clostridium kluyveri]|uniref:Site-2 protease family protein n=1 Tax=Clostridium kluyveri TaxID=1534 RepID=A0A1L5F3S9_CLOKL|nr:site-2 protease family protein [Clostridium kluyveri]APM37669.1 site-2 protease family protein [Clostridium kluyveri]UZQ52312.1 site-2 protease family protein [Clostridium kluyveri]
MDKYNRETESSDFHVSRDNDIERYIVNDSIEKYIVQGNVETKKENLPTIAKSKKNKKDKKGIWGIIGIIIAALIKLKSIIILIFAKLKFLLIFFKLGKFASTLISMLLMILVYAKIYGWAFGLGFVVLLFVHEMGHYLSAKAVKLDVTLPLFIPFVGALISMKEEPKDAVTEAKVAIGGPLIGSLGALICFILYFSLKENFLMALAYTGFMLNLFNLIPLHPLDGGRIVSAISPKLWFIGIPIAAIALFKFFNPIILLLLILGIFQVINQYKNPDKAYYEVNPATRWIFAFMYFGLILFLGMGIAYIHGIHEYMLVK